MDMSATTITPNTAAGTGGSCGGLNIVPPTKSPEAESETPPRIQPSKPISFYNGVLKRHAPPQVVYKECLKNHAASLGGHALDGCGEFMPAQNAVVSDPTSLKCAACGCHRNFHRREPEDLTAAAGNVSNITPTLTHVIEYHPHHRHHPLPPPPSSTPHPGPGPNPSRGPRSPGSGSQSPPPISSSFYPGSAPHMLLALSSGGGPEATTPTTNNGPHHHPHNIISQFPTHVMNSGSTSQPSGSRKRFRTKFSQEQKEKMHEFAEKVGWKMQKTNEEMVINFCNEIGVERGVFKVWMHNNKNTFGKRSNNIITSIITTPAGGAGGGVVQGSNANIHLGLNVNDNDDDDDDHNEDDDDDDDDDDDANEIGNLNGNGNGNGNGNSHRPQHFIHHHHQQQYNNGVKISESNAAPTNASSSSS